MTFQKKLLYYTILITGIVVCLVGITNLASNWGRSELSGIVVQVTGVICIIGGAVNLLVAGKVRADIKSEIARNQPK